MAHTHKIKSLIILYNIICNCSRFEVIMPNYGKTAVADAAKLVNRNGPPKMTP